MLRRDLEGNLQLALSHVREQSAQMDKYMSFTEQQIKVRYYYACPVLCVPAVRAGIGYRV